ncbi:MAG: TonB-dependent receptor [Candidatus Omnitrophota bacterium]
MKYLFSIVLAAVLLFSVAAGSSSAGDIDLEKIVVTPSKIEEYCGDTACSVDVVTAKEIEYSGAKDVAAALTGLTSVDISDYGGVGELKSIRMRGSTAEQVLVTVDGRPVNNPRSGQVDLSTIPLDNIERIEVVHGPASSLYGSQAMGGTVNIITKQPPIKGFETSVSSSFGTFRTYTDRLLHGGRVGGFGYLFSGGYLSSQGFRDNSKVNSKDANAKFEYRLNDSSTLRLGSGFYRNKSGLPGAVSSPDTDDKQLALTNYLDLAWNFKPDNLTGFSARIYRNYDRLEFIENSAGSIFDSANAKNIHSTVARGLELQFNRKLFDFYQLIGGLNYVGNYNDSTSSAKHKYNVKAAYMENQWDVTSKFKLNFSARVDDYSNFGAQFSPSLSAVYKISENIKLHGLVARSFRAPTFNDLYWPDEGWSKGNPNLRPEKGTTGEVGIDVKPCEYFSSGVTYYRSVYKQLINWAADDNGVWSPTNIGSALIDGVEFSNTFYLLDNLELGLNYTYMRAIDDKTRKYLIYQPKNKADLLLRYKGFKGVVFEFKGQFTDKRFHNAANSISVKRFFVFGLGLSKKFSKGVTCFGSVDNLSARRYQVIRDYPMPGFSATGGLKLEF